MITVSNITKTYGDVTLYADAGFEIYRGEKIGLVGPNGAGKTTFFRMIAGQERPDCGAIAVQNNVRIAYFSQDVGEMRGRSALQEVISGNDRVSQLAERLKSYEDTLCKPDISPEEMETTLAKMGDDQSEYEKLGGFDLESNAQTILTGLGIAPSDHQNLLEEFSSGWKMRIALAKVLIVMPDLIMMDEPTNYLDMETILWLENWLKNFKGAVLMTTHDRDFMNNVVKKIIEVANETVTTYSGNYDFYEQEKALRLKQNEAAVNRQESMFKKEEAFIARFKARASHAAQVQSRVRMLAKIERVDRTAENDEMEIMLPEIPRGGNDVVVIRGLSKTWKTSAGADKNVFSGLDAVVRRQNKIAVVGVNGAGKSTFLKVLCGLTAPSSGEAIVGPGISIGYFGQSTLEELPENSTVFAEVGRRLPDLKDAAVRNLLAAFLFKGDEIYKQIKILSGGEKTRLILSWLLSLPYNCLVLDEPTNHLDIGSREVLLAALGRYTGTILLVSHDRYFLREIVDRVFEVERGRIKVYEGDYCYYLETRGAGR
ncbi:MAG: ABC-F family ATP-binding cassette domain-containing protein [Chitinivibrionales bacterium]|nr:ABC-F family ATP-binding cassette domain-containing protein [Chitinivibrionales bacterium]